MILESSDGFSSKSRHCTNMTAPECASPLFPLLSSAQYLSCLVLSLQWFPARYLCKFQNHLGGKKGCWEGFYQRRFRSGAVMGFLLAANRLLVLYVAIKLFNMYSMMRIGSAMYQSQLFFCTECSDFIVRFEKRL